MSGAIPKILILIVCTIGIGVSGFFGFQSWKALNEVGFPVAPITAEAAPAADAHGGGHGGGGHGEAAPAPAEGGGHGEAAAGEHGAGEEGAAAVPKKKGPPAITLVTLDELFINVLSDDRNYHAVGIKLELELFEDQNRGIIETHQAGIKDTIIRTTTEQQFKRLQSLGGKLYYKELLVARVNDYLRQPVLRDIHFSSFFLQ